MQFGPSKLSLQEAGDWQAADFTARLLEHGTATTLGEGQRGNGERQTVTLPEEKPFFLGCGLFRPHLPFHAPQEFFDRFPTDEMTGLNRESLDAIIADLQDLPSGAMRFSDYENGKMRTVMEHARKVGGVEAEIPAWRDLVQAYLACVSFADTCIGRILEGYERSPRRSQTVVLLWSDHGFHVGAKYHIAKQALWEEANRVQFIVHDPRNPASCDGAPRRQLVSLNDFYPTICDLAGASVASQVEVGNSLVPLLKDARAPEVHPVLLMTYMEGNHSLRTPTYRFMRYRDASLELYDMIHDPRQLKNLAQTPGSAATCTRFSSQLDQWVAGEVIEARERKPREDSE
jgi:arylsulfatase A-like enzyme